MDEEESDYEKMRMNSIEENRRMLQELGLLKPFQERRPVFRASAPRRRPKVVKKKPVAETPDSDSDFRSQDGLRRALRVRLRDSYDESQSDYDFSFEETSIDYIPRKPKLIFPKGRPNIYGAIEGIEVGTLWETRMECSADGIHRPTVAGIHGGKDGAYSLALSGGYEDDIDLGESFTYTGEGGRDLKGTKTDPKNLRTAPQSKDQTLSRGNLALCMSSQTRNPVRVIRGYKLKNEFAPEFGYRYDGLYRVEKYWSVIGKAGFMIFKFALKRCEEQPPPPWGREGDLSQSFISTNSDDGSEDKENVNDDNIQSEQSLANGVKDGRDKSEAVNGGSESEAMVTGEDEIRIPSEESRVGEIEENCNIHESDVSSEMIPMGVDIMDKIYKNPRISLLYDDSDSESDVSEFDRKLWPPVSLDKVSDVNSESENESEMWFGWHSEGSEAEKEVPVCSAVDRIHDYAVESSIKGCESDPAEATKRGCIGEADALREDDHSDLQNNLLQASNNDTSNTNEDLQASELKSGSEQYNNEESVEDEVPSHKDLQASDLEIKNEQYINEKSVEEICGHRDLQASALESKNEQYNNEESVEEICGHKDLQASALESKNEQYNNEESVEDEDEVPSHKDLQASELESESEQLNNEESLEDEVPSHSGGDRSNECATEGENMKKCENKPLEATECDCDSDGSDESLLDFENRLWPNRSVNKPASNEETEIFEQHSSEETEEWKGW